MAKARPRDKKGESKASLAVLAVLTAAAVWLALSQARFNPAVIVAMSHPKGAASVVGGTTVSDTVTSGYLSGLSQFPALSPVEGYNAETLSDKIDGKAELYLASGFEEMSCRAFAAPDASQTRVMVYLYAMGSPKDAFAVFSGQRRPGSEPLSLTQNAYSTENAVFFTAGRFYAELVGGGAGPELAPALESMAEALLAALPKDKAAASEAELFPAKGLRADSVRLAVSDALGMQGLDNVYTADFDLDGKLASAFLAMRANGDDAASQAKAYADFLVANGFKRGDATGAPPGAVVFTMEGMAQVVMAQGKALAGVHDAPDVPTALALATELSRSITEKSP